MGLLVEGVWVDQWYDTKPTGGRFEREESTFRNWVTADGAPGPSGDGGFQAASGRYHLYVSYACPWAHRALIFRQLKGLEQHISVSVVHPLMQDKGWTLSADYPGATGDLLLGKSFLHQVYVEAAPNATTRVTVPVLWDKQTRTIVSNESAEIVRMFNTAFDGLTGSAEDFCPKDLRSEIDEVNARVYETVNNGVYRSGFATTQDAYDNAVTALFGSLDWLEERLSRHRYLVGDRVTEADWRLFPTLVRFDPVYVGHFKCNIRRLVDYPNLWAYTRELYQWPGIAETVNMDHVRYHYYASHKTINPHRIIPAGPGIDFTAPHGRDKMTA
ncbi:MAG: glutathione S-transferase family protein [Paracoccaceae bacterium]